jgi:hypothetical protein
MGVQLMADPNEKPVSSNFGPDVPILIIDPIDKPTGSNPPSTGCGIRTSDNGGGGGGGVT